jgi:nicotinamidase-related amidase
MGQRTSGGTAAVAELARPVEGTLFFAGEATEAGLSRTVASALASGYRAAAVTPATLRPLGERGPADL